MDEEGKAILRAINTNLRNLDATMREAHNLKPRRQNGVTSTGLAPTPSVAPQASRSHPSQAIQAGAVSMAVHPPGGVGGQPVASVSFDIGTPPGSPVQIDPAYEQGDENEPAASA